VLQKELSLILANGEKEDSKALGVQTQIAFIYYPALQGSAGIYSSANLVPL
jgi:hypothetical protein